MGEWSFWKRYILRAGSVLPRSRNLDFLIGSTSLRIMFFRMMLLVSLFRVFLLDLAVVLLSPIYVSVFPHSSLDVPFQSLPYEA